MTDAGKRLLAGCLASALALALLARAVFHLDDFPSDVLGGLLVVSAWTCAALAVRLESLSSR
jgi:hypothetical protein